MARGPGEHRVQPVLLGYRIVLADQRGQRRQDEPGEIATYRVNGLLPVIVWDREANGGMGARKVVPMRWGFPDPRDWRRPTAIVRRSDRSRR